VTDSPAGIYSESELSLTVTLAVRNRHIVSGDLPTAPYIENIGVRPDVPLNYMTEENLHNKGKPFLDRLLEIAAEKILGN